MPNAFYRSEGTLGTARLGDNCGDLNSRPELSGWRSQRLSVMRVIVLHPYIKFEVRRPSHSEAMGDSRSRR